MKLTPHFSLGEMTKSQTALRLGLDNNPDPEGVASLRTAPSSLIPATAPKR